MCNFTLEHVFLYFLSLTLSFINHFEQVNAKHFLPPNTPPIPLHAWAINFKGEIMLFTCCRITTILRTVPMFLHYFKQFLHPSLYDVTYMLMLVSHTIQTNYITISFISLNLDEMIKFKQCYVVKKYFKITKKQKKEKEKKIE
jgi:hypothetical protein